MGKFIVLEGLDGSGLHEYAQSAFDYLADGLGLKQCWLTKEPSDGPVGSLLRWYLSNRLELAEESLPVFFAADRVNHLHRANGIIDHLEKGSHVICDRYYLSTYAYQTISPDGGTDGFQSQLTWLRNLNERWCPVPDLTIFIDAPIESCLRRLLEEQRELGHYQAVKISGRNSTTEEAKRKLVRIRENYFVAIGALMEDPRRKENIRVVGGDTVGDAPTAVKKQIRKELERLFNGRKSLSSRADVAHE